MALYMAVLYMTFVQRGKKRNTLRDTAPERAPNSTLSAPLQMAEFELAEGQTAVGTGQACWSPKLRMKIIPHPQALSSPLVRTEMVPTPSGHSPLGVGHTLTMVQRNGAPAPHSTPPGGERDFTEQTRKSLRGLADHLRVFLLLWSQCSSVLSCSLSDTLATCHQASSFLGACSVNSGSLRKV